MASTFGEWLQTEMRTRGMIASELSRRAGVSQQCIYDLVHDRRQPGPRVLRSVVEALGASQQSALAALGFEVEAPEPKVLTIQELDLLRAFQRHKPDAQRRWIDLIRTTAPAA